MSHKPAHAMVASAIRKGFLAPAWEHDCVDCGLQAEEYDHRDYNRPLDVEPVCHQCNLRRGPAIPFVPAVRNFRKKARLIRTVYFKDAALERAAVILGGYVGVCVAAGASDRLVKAWAEGTKRPLKYHCRRIAADCDGAVTAAELRPDIFGDTAA